MKALITGGAGYIGSHCNRLFSEKGVETVVLDDLSYGRESQVVTGRFVCGDFGDKELLGKLFQAEKFDAIIHFAASVNLLESLGQPAKYYENNVVKMKTLLDVALEHGIKNVVFSSSAAVYGEPQATPIEEGHPKHPINPYGTSKLIGEMMLADYQRGYGLNYVAFRYFNVAGASQDAVLGEMDVGETRLIPNMFRNALSGKPLTVFGGDYQTADGTCIKDYIHVLDIAEAHYLAMQHLIKGGGSDCFNLGTHTGFSVLEMIKATEKIVGKEIPYTIGPRRAGDSPKLIASNQKARDILGWEPRYSDIETILRDAYNWQKKLTEG
ncbi:MAG: UDP-glucose 4-epimerase GalE [Lachnospiraceae bacterium]|jgi:UDP-glucose 4-epimerase|nr:UDP-glucose 4-epimerase GalE [Lachnospiraceae bacterium]